MAKAPAFQFYPSDFLTGTAHFRAEEVGAYIRLLCFQWEHGEIDENDFESISGLQSEKLIRVKKKFKCGANGFFLNERLEKTRLKQELFSKQQSERGKLGGRPPQEKKPNESQVKPELNPNDNPKESGLLAKPIIEERSMKIEDEERKKEIEDEVPPQKKEPPISDLGNSIDENLKVYEEWGILILEQKDQFFETLLYKEKLDYPPKEIINDHLELLARYPKMQPQTQQAFRYSLLKHFRENKDKIKHGKNNNGSTAANAEKLRRVMEGKL